MPNLMVSNMTQEQKDLLLKDLCARLPYGIKGNYQNSDDKLLRSITIVYNYLKPNGMVMTGDIKPYLFPLSSMTEEQTEELIKLINTGQNDNNEFMRSLCRIDFYHKHHFDYRGLIPMGLAIDATNLGIYE